MPVIAILIGLVLFLCYCWAQKFVGLIIVLLIGLVLFFCYIWAEKFVELMLLEDRHFPGRYDKILWFIFFLLVAPVAPFAFGQWKTARTVEHAALAA